MLTYKIHLIRAGSPSDDARKKITGQLDLPLCDTGRQELRDMMDMYAYPEVERVFSCPLSRCVNTAEILYPDSPLTTLDGLMDINLGEFQGKSVEELGNNPAFKKWVENSQENTPPGGEQVQAFSERVVVTLSRVFKHMLDEGVTSAAVITHGGVIMSLLAMIGLPRLPIHEWAVKNGTGYTLLMTTQMWMRDCAAEVSAYIPAEKPHE